MLEINTYLLSAANPESKLPHHINCPATPGEYAGDQELVRDL
jgi:hypothetical protein